MMLIFYTMAENVQSKFSRRERQIMDIVYRMGRATANEVIAELSGEPHSSTVRTQLRVLEEKGHLRHEENGMLYVYYPVTPRRVVRQSALRHMIETFFEGSAEKMMATLLGGGKLSEEELSRMGKLIDKAKRGDVK
jgi:predicted transcriptional regulator